MARILVGVPFFRIADSSRRCLVALVDTPAEVLAIDNAADDDVKQVIQSFNVTTIHNAVNGYCNGGWNQTLEYGLKNGHDIIGLGSSDAALRHGWYQVLTDRAEKFKDEVWLPALDDGTPKPTDSVVLQNIAGYVMFLPRAAAELVYPIPRTLRHWFGDLYIFQTLRKVGWKTVVLNRMLAEHHWTSVTAKTPEAYQVIAEDKVAWRALGYPWTD